MAVEQDRLSSPQENRLSSPQANIKRFSICQVCDEGVTNPICPGCLEQESTQFLLDHKPTLIPLLRARSKIFNVPMDAVSICVSCGDAIKVCPHCYCKEIALWLYEDHPNIARQFVTTFNYELKSVA
ncbi:hypothetical protein HY641_01545 [Candidatus Woesearchaeota archaeon]|nr:hypothetical protein [Candidatus Woesearchaeota archaeon]